jgi:hypothetical protein
MRDRATDHESVAPRKGDEGAMDAPSLLRWLSFYGSGSLILRAGARTGDPYGRICFDPRTQADPYPYYDLLRRRGPVVNGRFAAVTAHYGTVYQVLRSEKYASGVPEQFLPRPARAAISWAREPDLRLITDPPSMLVVDGAEHARLRRIVGAAFTPRAMAHLEARTATIATTLLRDARRDSSGPFDLVTGYAEPLPALVLCEILGIPERARATFLERTRRIIRLTDFGISYRTYLQAEQTVRDTTQWLRTHFAHLAADPGSDLLSDMLGRIDPEQPDQVLDLLVNTILLLVGGLETTVNLITAGTLLLSDHPDQRDLLREDPALWPNAIDEILRIESPSQGVVRHPVEKVRLGSVDLRPGKLLVLLLGAANRDPAVFADPGRFDVTRPNSNAALAFGAGPHFCIGAGLARMVGRIGLRTLTEAGTPAPAGPGVRSATRTIRGWATLPVRVESAQARPTTRRSEAPSAPSRLPSVP